MTWINTSEPLAPLVPAPRASVPGKNYGTRLRMSYHSYSAASSANHHATRCLSLPQALLFRPFTEGIRSGCSTSEGTVKRMF